MLTSATTVLGMAPLLYEQSQQAQFLKPTVITLVYGLGFGMVLVLLVVPALMAMQNDVSRHILALKRGLTAPVGSLRAGLLVAVALLLGWAGATLGWVVWTGALLPFLAGVLPAAVAGAPLVAALMLFVVGAAALALAGYVLGAILQFVRGSRRRAAP